MIARHLLFFPILFFIVRVFANEPDSTGAAAKAPVKFVFYPAAGYSPETSLEFGAVGVFLINRPEKNPQKIIRPATIVPHFLATLKGQFMSAIKSEIYVKENYFINVNLRFFDYPDQFFGIGNNTSGEKEGFTDRFFKVDGKLAWIFREHAFAGINFDWSIDHLNEFTRGGILDTGNITGTNGGYVIGLGPFCRFDTRDNTVYPSKGLLLEANALFYPGSFTSGYSFSSLKLDARYFTKVFSDNILAIQGSFQSTGGESIPFYKLPRLGGDIRMRGIEHENRYIDRNAWYIQVEGRRHLFWRLGGVLFAGIGKVHDNLSGFDLNNLKYVFGIGGRFKPFKNDLLNLRMDMGKGPGDQYGIYVGVGEAF